MFIILIDGQDYTQRFERIIVVSFIDQVLSYSGDWDCLFVDSNTSADLYKNLILDISRNGSPAFQIPSTHRIGLPENNYIRKDSKQTIYYGKDLFDVWMYRLLPQQVVVLSLFDGIRTIGEVARIVADISHCNQTAAEIKVRYLLHSLHFSSRPTFFTAAPDNTRVCLIFDPLNYLIPDTKLSVRLDAPVSLILMSTDKCLTDCDYCYACRKHVEKENLLTVKRIHELIDEAHEIGVISINVNGGDIFAREEHMEILEHMLSYNIEPGISTKAYISKEKAKELAKIGLQWLQVGLDSTREMSEKLVRRTGYFDRIVETIRNLTDAGVRVRTNSIITRESLHLLPELVDFLMTLPLFDIKVAPMFLGMYRGNESMLLTKEQKQWYRNVMEEKVKQYPDHKINWECEEDFLDVDDDQISNWFNSRPYCSSGRTQIVIAPDGKVVTCEQSPQEGRFVCGDVKHQSIMDVWNSEALKKWYAPPREEFQDTVCFDCDDFQPCIHGMGHCWLQVLKMQGREYGPHPYCPKANKPKQHWR